ncbi:pyridoxal phosphate-dependent aminotransferase [Demetria terragena]|uniref:pyridoxal phosphate-dependent aminotransferase n=1 Tax=Demetria terragena TaxID=63959 RepID=UPI000370AAC9|nr:pyridoxal phosphate-dependent aminotransferase [Demetria terragena]
MSSPLIPRLHGFGTTIFAEMSALALRTGAINLGQGFPDSDGPSAIKEAARAAIADGLNQYPPGRGLPVLRAAIADHQARHYGLDLDPDQQVLPTVGATEGIASSILALVEPGDEVVTFEPYYDSYTAMFALAGVAHRTCVLRAPEFAVDPDELRAAFSSRTKLVLLNTPHNPTGKVFSRDELQLIADLAQEHDAFVVTDEVYEHLTFDGSTHIPIATLPGMADRTLTIGSAGKTFSLTGWKVGWVTGPADLVQAALTVKQYLTFSGGGPFQAAVAEGLRLGQPLLDELHEAMDHRRHLMVEGLRQIGFDTWLPQGTYFAIGDARPLGWDDATDLCWQLPDLCGVVAIPVSGFHDDPSANASLLRFAFCKDEDKIREGLRRLQSLG